MLTRYFLGLISAILLMCCVSNANAGGWIVYHDGYYKGKLIDLETSAPIGGAVVAGVWHVDQYGGPGGPVQTFCDAKEALTDKNGDFEVPKASCWHWWPFSTLGLPQFTVFKPGYLGYPPLGFNLEEKKTRMPDFKGGEFLKKTGIVIKLGRPKTKEERVSTLSDAGSTFTPEDESYFKMPNLLKLINEEARNLGYDEIGPSKRR